MRTRSWVIAHDLFVGNQPNVAGSLLQLFARGGMSHIPREGV